MLCGAGLDSLDGSAWYHPLRLTIDSGAVAAGNANPAQAILDVLAIHGSDPSAASPDNEFLDHLIPFLLQIERSPRPR